VRHFWLVKMAFTGVMILALYGPLTRRETPDAS